MECRSVLEMKELMLSASLDSRDFLLAQLSRGCVRKLACMCGVMSPHLRDSSAFDGSAKALHCFFNFW